MSRRKATAAPELHDAKPFEEAGGARRAIRRFAASKIGAALFGPTSHHFDKLVDRVSGGRFSVVGVATGLPVVLLTTTGARSHTLRTVPVIGIPYANEIAVIASNFGGAKHPGWYYNLKANPQARVAVNALTWDAIARLAPTHEREEIWATAVALYPGYDEYEDRAEGRRIEAFVLSRR